jgi:hypothetical protein
VVRIVCYGIHTAWCNWSGESSGAANGSPLVRAPFPTPRPFEESFLGEPGSLTMTGMTTDLGGFSPECNQPLLSDEERRSRAEDESHREEG